MRLFSPAARIAHNNWQTYFRLKGGKLDSIYFGRVQEGLWIALLEPEGSAVYSLKTAGKCDMFHAYEVHTVIYYLRHARTCRQRRFARTIMLYFRKPSPENNYIDHFLTPEYVYCRLINCRSNRYCVRKRLMYFKSAC